MKIIPSQGQIPPSQNSKQTNQAKIINLSQQYKNGNYTDSNVCKHILTSDTRPFNAPDRYVIYAWFTIISIKENKEPESIEQLQDKIVANFAQNIPSNYTLGNASQFFNEMKNPNITVVQDKDNNKSYDLRAIRQEWENTQVSLFSTKNITSDNPAPIIFDVKHSSLTKKDNTYYNYQASENSSEHSSVISQEHVEPKHLDTALNEFNKKYSSLATENEKKQLLLYLIKSGNDHMVNAAITKLQCEYSEEECFRTLENNKDIPIIKAILCTHYFKSGNSKYGLILYEEIVHQKLETKSLIIENKLDNLFEYLILQPYDKLEKLALAGSIHAKLSLALIFARDLPLASLMYAKLVPIKMLRFDTTDYQRAKIYISECINLTQNENLLHILNELSDEVAQYCRPTATHILERLSWICGGLEDLADQPYDKLQQLSLDGSIAAKLVLVMVLCKDLLRLPFFVKIFEKYPDSLIDHQLAKAYLSECIQLKKEESFTEPLETLMNAL